MINLLRGLFIQLRLCFLFWSVLWTFYCFTKPEMFSGIIKVLLVCTNLFNKIKFNKIKKNHITFRFWIIFLAEYTIVIRHRQFHCPDVEQQLSQGTDDSTVQ